MSVNQKRPLFDYNNKYIAHDVYIPYPYIAEYIRDNQGRPYGLVAYFNIDGRISIGYSLADKLDRAHFCKNKAFYIAVNRAIKNLGRIDIKLPTKIYDKAIYMQQRAKSYFKTNNLPHIIRFNNTDFTIPVFS